MIDDSNRIPTNLRMLLIFEALAASGRPMTPSELGEEIDLPKPTLHRLCTTLEDEGFLIRDYHSGRLRPARRSRVMALGLQNVSRLHIARRTVLKSVASKIKETCNLAAPTVAGMTYLDRVDTPWPLRFQLPVGTEVPFHCTASGKLFLSSFNDNELTPLLDAMEFSAEGPNSITDSLQLRDEIKAIREAGYSWDNQEFMAGMIAFAVPILDLEGRFSCAIAFHAPMQRIAFEEAREHVPTLREGAARIHDILFGEEKET
jgi:DNA-binding IclR family transcriptional regulator